MDEEEEEKKKRRDEGTEKDSILYPRMKFPPSENTMEGVIATGDLHTRLSLLLSFFPLFCVSCQPVAASPLSFALPQCYTPAQIYTSNPVLSALKEGVCACSVLQDGGRGETLLATLSSI